MGRLNVPASGRVYLDADALIYSVEKLAPYDRLLEPVWLAAQAGHITIIGSELLLLETLVKPVQMGDTELAHLFQDLLLHTREVDLHPITRPVLEQALQLRADYNLKTPDALHAATALLGSCNLFVSNDRAFTRVANLNVAILSELTE